MKILLTLIMTFMTNFAQSTVIHDDPVIVFDFGGVIAHADTTKMALFLMDSFQIDKEELSSIFIEMQRQGGSEEQFWREFAEVKCIVLPDDWTDQFEANIHESLTPIPGTLTLIQELRTQGYQTAILSDMTEYQAKVIHNLGYFNGFDPVVLSHENRVKKPHPEAFQILLRKLEKPASSVIFTDDRKENVEAAKKEGIDAIHFIDTEQLREELTKRGFDVTPSKNFQEIH